MTDSNPILLCSSWVRDWCLCNMMRPPGRCPADPARSSPLSFGYLAGECQGLMEELFRPPAQNGESIFFTALITAHAGHGVREGIHEWFAKVVHR